MIRSRADLMLELQTGETVARLETWAIFSTGEAVHGVALRAAIKRDEVQIIQRDICGKPMQYGARLGASSGEAGHAG